MAILHEKKKSLTKLKKDLWKHFALWIKLSRVIDFYNDREVACFTCGAVLKIGTSNCQAGHWLPKRGYPVHYFEPDQIRPQCFHCNINLSGNTEVFRRNLELEIGKERVEEIYNTRHQSGKRTRSWYLEQIKKYKLLNKSLGG